MQPWITFQNAIQYAFKNIALLSQALTHKSYAFEHGKAQDVESHNERLEFLGDAVLDLLVAQLLMKISKTASEGELSKRRAALVNEKTLSEIARQLRLPEYLVLGKGESLSHGTEKDSILASALEALIGAIYLDGGYEEAKNFVEKYFTEHIETRGEYTYSHFDFKTKLQEICQAAHKLTPVYKLDKAEGPDHQKTFFVSVYVQDQKVSEGRGKNRKEAEQCAANDAIKKLENKDGKI